MPRTLIKTMQCLCLVLFITALPHAARAGEGGDVGGEGEVVETIEVKQAKTDEPRHPSLRFLRDNRVFLRAQLDLLQLKVTRTRIEDAQMIDARLLRLQEMSAAIAAARDTVRAGTDLTAIDELLASVTELGAIEAELALMEQLLIDQRRRLLLLEDDFLGHQETALVILVRGIPGGNAPASIELAEESDVVRVELTPEQRASLERGGIAQIYHEFVEPRRHVFSVRFEGDSWRGAQPVAVAVEAARDRLTFLELDLTGLDRNHETAGLLTNIWYR